MFDNLLESKPRKQRSTAGTTASVVFHVAVIAGLVYATANAGQKVLEKPKVEDVKFIEAKKPPPPPPPKEQPPPPDVVAGPPPPKGFQTVIPPIDIPDKLPDVDLSKAVTNAADFSGRGAVGGVARGVEGGKGPVNTDQPLFAFQVDKPPLAREGNPDPKFPPQLSQAGIGGTVLATFVVDTTGRPEMSTFKVLKSPNEAFTAAVKRVLPQRRYYPGETGGRKLKVWVQEEFVFNAK